MKTSLSSNVSAEVFKFAVQLGCAARVFTMAQVARHRELSWRTQPKRRARECLSPYRDSFDVLPWFRDKPYLWRLTNKEKRRQGVKFSSVGASAHTEHWLTIGDVWLELVFSGLRPTKWFTEGRAIGRFDVFAEINGSPYLFEVQLSPLSKREWERKWHQRIEWLKEKKWKDAEWGTKFSSKPPRIVLVTTQPMSALVPKGVLHAKNIEQVKYILRPPQK